ncbi:hypothetical protein [Sphingobacterium sp. DR205]|uniref:hypothetical protein n=1 Tax=Sphingobacterium sp. DR205 TaxID=2713573 RepID=UPI0013E40FD9|nr:hypothetical protein [Sphingobacterium sp. DR205]QIH33830.1 hypothetical protein G6053_13480 [Sphingobacterium sp. DR205]
MKNIEFKKQTEVNSKSARIGGKSFISSNLWPKDETGKFMTLVFCLPSELVSRILGITLENNTFFSVFSTYSQDKSSYFLDKVIYNTIDDEELDIIKNNTTVIYHTKENNGINLSEYEIPPYEITESGNEDEETFWGGQANFLQEEMKFEEYDFFMQFYAGNFPDDYKNILFLADAIGYIFIKKNININECGGLYFGQST